MAETGFNYWVSDEQDSTKFLKSIYDNFVNEKFKIKMNDVINEGGEMATEAANANLIQQFLNMLLYPGLVGEQNVFKMLDDKMLEPFNNKIAGFIRGMGGIKKFRSTGLGTGTDFEKNFQKLLDTIFLTKINGETIGDKNEWESFISNYQSKLSSKSTRRNATNMSMGLVSASLTSTASLDSNIIDLKNKVLTNALERAYVKGAPQIKYQKIEIEENNKKKTIWGYVSTSKDKDGNTKTTNYALGTFLPMHDAKAQKIDSASKHTLKVDLSATAPQLDKVLGLLSDCTFSDKAYNNNSWGEVTLGATNPFRVFFDTSMLVYPSVGQVLYHWYRFLGCLDHHLKTPFFHQAGLYFYKIRYMYELTGIGQNIDQSNMIKKFQEKTGGLGAKYIVIFNNGFKGKERDKITVRSTRQIISNFIQKVSNKYNVLNSNEGKRDTDDGAPIAYSKDYILYSKMKIRTTGIEWD